MSPAKKTPRSRKIDRWARPTTWRIIVDLPVREDLDLHAEDLIATVMSDFPADAKLVQCGHPPDMPVIDVRRPDFKNAKRSNKALRALPHLHEPTNVGVLTLRIDNPNTGPDGAMTDWELVEDLIATALGGYDYCGELTNSATGNSTHLRILECADNLYKRLGDQIDRNTHGSGIASEAIEPQKEG